MVDLSSSSKLNLTSPLFSLTFTNRISIRMYVRCNKRGTPLYFYFSYTLDDVTKIFRCTARDYRLLCPITSSTIQFLISEYNRIFNVSI